MIHSQMDISISWFFLPRNKFIAACFRESPKLFWLDAANLEQETLKPLFELSNLLLLHDTTGSIMRTTLGGVLTRQKSTID